MGRPIFVRELSKVEFGELATGLKSSKPFTVRRCQMVLASTRGETAPKIAKFIGCDEQTVRNAIKAFNERGVATLQAGSRRPKTVQPLLGEEQAERLKALLHRSPRDFGKQTSLWTLELAAEVSFAEGLTPRQVSGECIRLALKRLGISWKRAKHWITSPDPEYERKKTPVTGASDWHSSRAG